MPISYIIEPNTATVYQQPNCLNSRPLCCQQPNYETSNGQHCPDLLCNLPLCKNNTNYSGNLKETCLYHFQYNISNIYVNDQLILF